VSRCWGTTRARSQIAVRDPGPGKQRVISPADRWRLSPSYPAFVAVGVALITQEIEEPAILVTVVSVVVFGRRDVTGQVA
jgi:hypothetical protein